MNYKEKLYNIIKLIKEKHFGFNVKYSNEEIEKIIENNITKYGISTKYEFYFITNKIINEILGIYDSHTELIPTSFINDFWYPYQFVYINNKLYVAYTSKKYKKYCGLEVIKINDVKIDVIIREMSLMMVSNNSSFICNHLSLFLSNNFFLKCIPSLRTIYNDIIITLRNNQNEEIEWNIKLEENKNELMEINYHKNYTFDIMNDVIVLHFNKCSDSIKMKKFIEKIKTVVSEGNITKFILDLRNNGGGNSEIFMPLYNYLKDKKVITLVNEKVFSGGVWAAVYMKNNNSILVGTEVSDLIDNFADRKIVEIDNDFKLSISRKYFYFKNNRFNVIADKSEFNNHDLKINKLCLDYEVSSSIEDIINHKDVILLKAIDLLDKII